MIPLGLGESSVLGITLSTVVQSREQFLSQEA